MAAEESWWLDSKEVIRHKKTGELRHVTARLLDADTGQRRYEVEDDTHTTRGFWYEEDLKAEFETVGVVVYRKPKHVLDGRLYDGE